MAKNLDQVKHGLPMHPQKKRRGDVVSLDSENHFHSSRAEQGHFSSCFDQDDTEFFVGQGFRLGKRDSEPQQTSSGILSTGDPTHDSQQQNDRPTQYFFLQDGRHLELKINEDG
jgi:hypothetical protein